MHTPPRTDTARIEVRGLRVVPLPERTTVVLRATRRPTHGAASPGIVPPPRTPRGVPPRPTAPPPAPAGPPGRSGGHRAQVPRVPADQSVSTGCTVALRLLHTGDPHAEPVFVDGTGRRRLLLRALGALVAAAALTYLGLVGGGALAGAPAPGPAATAPPPGVSSVTSDDLVKDQR